MKKSARQKNTRPRISRPVVIAIIALVVYGIFMFLNLSKILPDLQILVDMLICVVAMLFWLFFFAQFTLPLSDNKKRLGAFVRLFYYVLGSAGPAVRVENGKIKERKGEAGRSGPGVVLMDTASAGMIRQPAAFKEAIGPGVAFTEHRESLAATVDLHRVKETAGPQEQEDPFAPQLPDETDAKFQARQKRRFATQGLTGNGIEVVPRITIIVRLDNDLGVGGTPYGYNPDSVTKAIKNTPVDAQAAEAGVRDIKIAALPLQLAADIWKECISRSTLEELFNFQPGQSTLLQRIVAEMRSRLTEASYYRYDAAGNQAGQRIGSKEYSILKDRGVRVVAVSIPYLKMRKEIEDRLVQLWLSSWMMRARREQDFVEQTRSQQIELGKRRALHDFANGVSKMLGAQNPALRLTGEQVLRQLLRGTLTNLNKDPAVQRHALDEIDQLKELLEWSEKRSETA